MMSIHTCTCTQTHISIIIILYTVYVHCADACDDMEGRHCTYIHAHVCGVQHKTL